MEKVDCSGAVLSRFPLTNKSFSEQAFKHGRRVTGLCWPGFRFFLRGLNVVSECYLLQDGVYTDVALSAFHFSQLELQSIFSFFFSVDCMLCCWSTCLWKCWKKSSSKSKEWVKNQLKIGIHWSCLFILKETTPAAIVLGALIAIDDYHVYVSYWKVSRKFSNSDTT